MNGMRRVPAPGVGDNDGFYEFDTGADKSLDATEERYKLNREAWRLLDLINAEFQSDPDSVQCFDLRIVERVNYALALRREMDRTAPFPMLDR